MIRYSKVLFLGFVLCLPLMLCGNANRGNELQQIVDAGLAAGDPVIRIPPGRYEVAPRDGVHLLLKGIRDVAIDATGVEMICTETTLAVHVEDCVNLTIIGLTIDYDPLPFTQGRIVEISADRKSHIIEIMDGFPPAEKAYVFKHSIYTAEEELRFGSYYHYKLEVLEGGRLKIFGLRANVDGGEQVGDIVVASTRYLTGRYRPHAIIVENSRGTVMEGVTIYSSPCFGFFEEDSSGSVYRNCVVDRRAGRVHSLNADAFHSKHAEVGPQIISCKAMWQGDDCINICGDYHMVSSVDGDWLRIIGMERLRIEKGHTLQLITAQGERLADATVLEVRQAGKMSDADAVVLNAAELAPAKSSRMNRAYLLQIDRKADLLPGAVVASQSRMGNGFAVKDGIFGNNRSRGILIKASDGEISGNTLINTHMAGILIAPEYYWLESGFSHNLTIANNRILHPRREAIVIKGVGPFPGHQNIRITHNLVLSNFSPALHLKSVKSGRIANNHFLTPNGDPLPNPLRTEFCFDIDLD